MWLFFKLISPFIDPTTREKLKFNENLREYVPPEQLYDLFGGDCVFEYDHEKYWPEFLKLAIEKRETYMARWKAAGGDIGQSEWNIRVNDSVFDTARESTGEEATGEKENAGDDIAKPVNGVEEITPRLQSELV